MSKLTLRTTAEIDESEVVGNEKLPVMKLDSNDGLLAAVDSEATNPNAVELHLRLVDDVPVAFQKKQTMIDVSARFDKMRWEFFEPIAEGVHRLIARLTGLDTKNIQIIQTLRLAPGDVNEAGDGRDERIMHGSARLILRLPTGFEIFVSTRQFQGAIGSFLHQLKTGSSEMLFDLLPLDGDDVEQVRKEAANSEDIEDIEDIKDIKDGKDRQIDLDGRPSEGREIAAAVREVSAEVRSRVGGRTLPCSMVVESPQWTNHFELRGPLGPKPDVAPVPRNDIPLICFVDGYRKSTRVVYLYPDGQTNPAALEVAFDEGKWLPIIVEFAALLGQKFDAVFDEVQKGSRVHRTLKELARIDPKKDLLGN